MHEFLGGRLLAELIENSMEYFLDEHSSEWVSLIESVTKTSTDSSTLIIEENLYHLTLIALF